MTTSGQVLLSRAGDLPATSVESSIVLTFVLGRLLLCGLFCPFVSMGVGALESISMGIVGATAEVGELYDWGARSWITFSIATICFP